MGRNKQPTVQLGVPVAFGGVSIGVETARLGIKIDREVMSLESADEFLVGRRLTGRVWTVPKGEDPSQKHFLDGEKHEMAAVFDVKKIGISPTILSTGLTFSLKDVDTEQLVNFSGRGGRLEIYEVAALEDVSDDDEDEEGAEQETAGASA